MAKLENIRDQFGHMIIFELLQKLTNFSSVKGINIWSIGKTVKTNGLRKNAVMSGLFELKPTCAVSPY